MVKRFLSIGPIFIVIAAILWSLDGLLRTSLYTLPPIVIVFLEHLIGFFFLIPFLFKNRKSLKGITQKTWGAFFWVTILSSVLGTLFYTTALGKINFIQFSVVVLLQQLQPIFAVLFGWIVLREKIHKDFLPLFLMAMVGAYLVSFPTLIINLETGGQTVIAALFAIAAAFSWGSSTAFSRYALLQLPSLLVTALRFGLAALISFVLIFVFGAQDKILTLSSSQITTLFLITFSTGMVALAIYYYGLKRTPVRISAICELAWPLSAVVIDYVVFHRTLSPTQIVGSFLLLTAIYMVTTRRKQTV